MGGHCGQDLGSRGRLALSLVQTRRAVGQSALAWQRCGGVAGYGRGCRLWKGLQVMEGLAGYGWGGSDEWWWWWWWLWSWEDKKGLGWPGSANRLAFGSFFRHDFSLLSFYTHQPVPSSSPTFLRTMCSPRVRCFAM
jgi:hypothetical protein